ncbi:MAG: glycosyl transferase [Bacteroidota bacterium]|nr:glycosyl transferase [Bacteroidota bacterium]
MLYFATLLDINYLSRTQAMYESIKRHHNNFVLYIVCLDGEVYDYFKKNGQDNIVLITLKEIEEKYKELETIKSTRNAIDYIFTLSPFYPSYILQKFTHIPFICSLDCDQYFFNNVEFLFKALEKYSVLILPHRFTKDLKHLEVFGKYNVSFQVFKNDDMGNRCLALWRSQCLEWCSDVLEEDRFADQKYLDKWQEHFGNSVQAINYIGIGLAPWNLRDKKIKIRNKKVYVDDKMLVVYHYQGLRIVYKNLINSGLAKYNVTPSSSFVTNILAPIVNAIIQFRDKPVVDNINRNAHAKQKNLIAHISGLGMFYKQGKGLINLDRLYQLKLKKGKAYGLLNRLTNFYR